MPKPSYIICSESGAIDRYTNLVSVHNVIERILFHKSEDRQSQIPAGHSPLLSFRVMASWKCDENELGEEFEFENSIDGPGVNRQILNSGSFVFKTRIHRFFVNASGPPPPQEGTLTVTSKIRKTGDESGEWLSQQFEIDVERSPEPEAVPADSQ